MGCNHLAYRAGDASNAMLAAVGYNFGILLGFLSLLHAPGPPVGPCSVFNPA
jgi:IS5 family transposase